MNRDQQSRRIDQPEPCFVRMRLVKGGPYVGGRIFTRLGMLAAQVNGVAAEVEHVWTSGEIIDLAAWQTLDTARPDDPYRAVNPKTDKPIF